MRRWPRRDEQTNQHGGGGQNRSQTSKNDVKPRSKSDSMDAWKPADPPLKPETRILGRCL
jgi:hypothetical protein